MHTRLEQANAIVPGDWSSMRDVLRDLAADVDALKAKPGKGATTTADAGADSSGPGSAHPAEG